MRWLIDSDILIEGERENPAFLPWLELQEEVATADIVRAGFLLGVYAIGDAAKRQRGELFLPGLQAKRLSRVPATSAKPPPPEAPVQHGLAVRGVREW